MQLDHTHLKVDQTLLRFNESYLLVSNINIPVTEFHQLDAVLDRAQQFIAEDYQEAQENNIQYQVCATYELENTLTGETRQWSGSFNPKGNRYNSLSHFVQYQPWNFKRVVTHACSPNNVYSKLRFFHTQTAWVFRQLKSAIISLQARVGPLNGTIERRGLLQRRNGGHSRVHLTFLLA